VSTEEPAITTLCLNSRAREEHAPKDRIRVTASLSIRCFDYDCIKVYDGVDVKLRDLL
jgi:hypothetical protein